MVNLPERSFDLELSAFQSFLHHHMPLTRFMGLQPVFFGENEVRLTFPLHNNHNDKGTAFGGSTAAAMIVAGWSLVHLSLQNRGVDADVVIYRNSSQWLRPLYTDATVIARFQGRPDQARWGHRRQRVCCDVQVVDQSGQQCSRMQADYVILPARSLVSEVVREANG